VASLDFLVLGHISPKRVECVAQVAKLVQQRKGECTAQLGKIGGRVLLAYAACTGVGWCGWVLS